MNEKGIKWGVLLEGGGSLGSSCGSDAGDVEEFLFGDEVFVGFIVAKTAESDKVFDEVLFVFALFSEVGAIDYVVYVHYGVDMAVFAG